MNLLGWIPVVNPAFQYLTMVKCGRIGCNHYATFRIAVFDTCDCCASDCMDHLLDMGETVATACFIGRYVVGAGFRNVGDPCL